MLRMRVSCRERDQIDTHAPRAGLPTLDEPARSLANTPPGSPDMLFADVGGQLTFRDGKRRGGYVTPVPKE